MKRIALLLALVSGLVIVAAFVGTASAKAFTPDTAAWLAPSCGGNISDDIWEEETEGDCSAHKTGQAVCIDGVSLTIYAEGSELTEMLADIRDNGDSAALGACSVWTPPPAREAYCSVAGNTNPFTGAPIPAGTFLNLGAGQPNTDKHYSGDVPAWFVQGVGLTCSLSPTQAALAAASTQRVGAAGDPETPIPGIPDYAIYTFVPSK